MSTVLDLIEASHRARKSSSAIRWRVLGLLLAPLLFASMPAAAVGYKFTDIGDIGSVGLGQVTGLNKGGAVVGFDQSCCPDVKANPTWVWTPTTPNAITGAREYLADPYPAQPHDPTKGAGVNDAGHVALNVANVFVGVEQLNDQIWIWTGGNSFMQLPPGFFAGRFNIGNTAGNINNLDSVVGSVFNDFDPEVPAWWPSGAPGPVVLDSRTGFGHGLNNNGYFVGEAADDAAVQHATKWASIPAGITVPHTLNNVQDRPSVALAINDGGTAVGSILTGPLLDPSSVPKPLAWDPDGTERSLPLLGDKGEALAISATGDIVGYSSRIRIPQLDIVIVAVLWTNGTVIDLNSFTPPGWRMDFANAINDAGQIAGTAIDTDGRYHAVLLTPDVNRPPVAKCKAVTVNANASCQASASIDDGSSDPDGDAITLAQSPAGPYSLGATLVTLTVTDSNGAASSCSANVTVQDVTAPMVFCPASISATANAACKAAIPSVLADVRASDNCAAAGNLTKVQSPTPGTLVGLGTTSIDVTVTDESLNAASCSTSFTVSDTSPPTVTSSVTTPVLWSPTHELVTVGLAVSASDNCSANPTLGVTVYSNEPDQPAGDDDANFSPDARDVAPGTLRLRSERLQAGSGRVYLIVSRAMDSAASASASCNTVVVPHDQNSKSFAVVNALAGPAQAYCASNNGAVPAGYVQVGTGPVVGPKQ